ncbi:MULTISPECIES: hypothetical protein [Streptomyces]
MSGTKNGGHSGADDPFEEGGTSLLRQPKAVWATAGASVVAPCSSPRPWR